MWELLKSTSVFARAFPADTWKFAQVTEGVCQDRWVHGPIDYYASGLIKSQYISPDHGVLPSIPTISEGTRTSCINPGVTFFI